jgi:hypothetical protein
VSTNDAQPARIRHSCSELRASSYVHTSEDDRMLDAEEFGNGRLEKASTWGCKHGNGDDAGSVQNERVTRERGRR